MVRVTVPQAGLWAQYCRYGYHRGEGWWGGSGAGRREWLPKGTSHTGRHASPVRRSSPEDNGKGDVITQVKQYRKWRSWNRGNKVTLRNQNIGEYRESHGETCERKAKYSKKAPNFYNFRAQYSIIKSKFQRIVFREAKMLNRCAKTENRLLCKNASSDVWGCKLIIKIILSQTRTKQTEKNKLYQ